MAFRTSHESASDKPGKTTWGPLALSIAIHAALLIMVGGYVIVEKTIPRTPFVPAGPGPEEGLEPAPMPGPEEALETPDIPQPVNDLASAGAPAAEGEAATPADIIVSTGTSPTFNLPPAVAPPSASVPVLGGGTGSGRLGTGTGGSVGTGPGAGLRSLSTLFGSKGGGGSDTLMGAFYDLKQDPRGKPNEMNPASPGDNAQKDRLFIEAVARFMERWDEKELGGYFRSNDTLHTTQVFIPTMNAAEAPKAFNVDRDVRPTRWLVHYKGQFTAPRSGSFRFVGCGDDILAVRLDRKLVFNGSIMEIPGQMGQDREAVGRVRVGSQDWTLQGGEWFRLSAGKTYPVEILIGEVPGIDLAMFLLIQERGVDYEQRPGNAGPVLPIFQTAPTKLPKFDEEKEGPTVTKVGFAGDGS